MPPAIIAVIVIVVLIAFMILLTVAVRYKTCPPDPARPTRSSSSMVRSVPIPTALTALPSACTAARPL